VANITVLLTALGYNCSLRMLHCYIEIMSLVCQECLYISVEQVYTLDPWRKMKKIWIKT